MSESDKISSLAKQFFIYAEADSSAVRLMEGALRELQNDRLLVHCAADQDVFDCLRVNEGRGLFPDFVLVDFRLPGRDGLNVLRWLKERPTFKAIPVIVLSSSPLEENIQLATALGATDYAVKPDSIQELSVALSAWIERFSPERS